MASRARSPKPLSPDSQGQSLRTSTSNAKLGAPGSENYALKSGPKKMNGNSSTAKKLTDLASTNKPDGFELLAAYCQLWAYHNLVKLVTQNVLPPGALQNIPLVKVVFIFLNLASLSCWCFLLMLSRPSLVMSSSRFLRPPRNAGGL